MPNCWTLFVLWFGAGLIAPCEMSSRVRIRAGGSVLPASVFKVWKSVYQAYRSVYSDVDSTYDAINSAEGVRQFAANEYDYAATGEDLSEENYKNHTDFQLFPALAVPIAVVYNVPELSHGSEISGSGRKGFAGNLNLTRENLVGIFTGTIKYWNDSLLVENNYRLAEVNESITVAVRMDSAATTTVFTKALSSFSKELSLPTEFESFSDGCYPSGIPKKWNTSINIRCINQSWGLSAYIVTTKYSIGFIGSSEARDAHLADARLLNQDGNWVRPSVATTQAAMDNVSSDLGQRLTGSLINAPGPDSYPIACYTYILVRKSTTGNCSSAVEVYRMFEYLLQNSLAQSIVAEMIDAPLSGKVLKLVKEHAFSKMRCGNDLVRDLVALSTAIEDGSYDAWKVPVTIVCSLLFVTLVMCSAFLLYVKYTKNRAALRNTFIISLNLSETATKSSTSFPNTSMASSLNSKNITRESLDMGAGAGVVKVTSGEQYLVRQLCRHLSPETAQWATKVLLVRLKDKMAHPNVLRLVGVSWHDSSWKLVNGCPRKGRLQDVLHAGKYHLDAVFRYSILSDVAEGMIYLHRNGLVHGQLTSNSCYIDARWNVVIGDWEQLALHQAQRVPFIAFENLYCEARIMQETEKDIANFTEYLRSLYWSAPESITRDENEIFIITKPDKPGDVYSYGIIAYEVFTDFLPYEINTEHDSVTKPAHILTAAKVDNLRPRIPTDTLLNSLHMTKLITTAWNREPTSRPTFSDIQKIMRQANPKNRSIIDTMMQAVENYALSLEEKVAERTRELEKLTRNMEALLHSMLPASIADRLAKGLTVEPELYESSTLFFSDIVGFTSIAAASSPIDIVNLLNDLYSAFDGVIQRFDVYKVETIGDSYMCISGLPNRNGVDHAHQIASMSLEMLYVVTTIPIRHEPDKKLQIRIGAHSGAVVAGVVGITMPRYCIFGDTVNTASRMESSSLPMRIQISEATRLLLDKLQVYSIVARGESVIKGKGVMKTYWLIGKEHYLNPLPEFDPQQDEQLKVLLDEAQLK